MNPSPSQLLEESVEIAWTYLQRTGELENDAARYLSDVIEVMIRRGQRNRMYLANMAIIKYRTTKDQDNVVPIREDVGHGHQLDRAALDGKRVGCCAAAAATTADQGDLDLVAAGSVDSGNGHVGQSRNRG